MKEHLRQVFLHAVEAVSPQQLVSRSLSRQGNILGVHDKRYAMDNNIYLVGEMSINIFFALLLRFIIRKNLTAGVV